MASSLNNPAAAGDLTSFPTAIPNLRMASNRHFVPRWILMLGDPGHRLLLFEKLSHTRTQVKSFW
jgi:hypothetical protein